MLEIDDLLALFDTVTDVEQLGPLRDTVASSFGAVSEGASAKIAELEAANAELEAKYVATAARNFELMTAVTAPATNADEEDSDEYEDEGDVNEATEKGVSDLLKDEG